MNPLRHLTDSDLVAVANDCASQCSYYVAGWDYPESAARERDAAKKADRLFRFVHKEMRARGLHTTVPSLVSM